MSLCGIVACLQAVFTVFYEDLLNLLVYLSLLSEFIDSLSSTLFSHAGLCFAGFYCSCDYLGRHLLS